MKTGITPAALIGLFWSLSLQAWSGPEHVAIGTEAYNHACQMAWSKLAHASDSKQIERLKLACTRLPGQPSDTTRDVFTYDGLAGEWAALAADHTETPGQLTTTTLGDVVTDYRVFARIVVTNYKHFHPASVTAWRTEHLASIEAADSAARREGVHIVEDFEAALAVESFAQHYLQDSFSSGHMGFNRVASSNAATLVYHNTTSKHGRCVQNSKGEVWFTLGDDHLDRSDDGRAHVITAATLSYFDFLRTFVVGAIDTNAWQSVWSELPMYVQDVTYMIHPDEIRACYRNVEFVSLRGVSRPAEAATTIDLMTVTDNALYRPSLRGVMIGTSHDLFSIPVGYRSIPARGFVALGATTSQLGPTAALFDFGYLLHVGTSYRGSIAHEIGFGEFGYWSIHHRYRQASLRLLYAANLEAGRVYVRIQAGAARSGGDWGAHVSTGLGFVLRAGR